MISKSLSESVSTKKLTWQSLVHFQDNDIALRNELVRNLKESYPNDQRPSDGRIYRNIRYYQGCLTGIHNQTAEQYWWVLL